MGEGGVKSPKKLTTLFMNGPKELLQSLCFLWKHYILQCFPKKHPSSEHACLPICPKFVQRHTHTLINHPLIHRFLVYIIQLQLLKIFWPYFGELATKKNACVCFARMSFVTPHIFLGLASFHFLVISDRFISKQRSGIPSTLGEICTTHNIHTWESAAKECSWQ